jgi:hypothetical protein
MEMTHYMLHSKKIKLSFWGEAVVSASDILNRTPIPDITCMILMGNGIATKLLFCISQFSRIHHSQSA